MKISDVLEAYESVNVVAELREALGCPLVVHVVTVARRTVTCPKSGRVGPVRPPQISGLPGGSGSAANAPLPETTTAHPCVAR